MCQGPGQTSYEAQGNGVADRGDVVQAQPHTRSAEREERAPEELGTPSVLAPPRGFPGVRPLGS